VYELTSADGFCLGFLAKSAFESFAARASWMSAVLDSAKDRFLNISRNKTCSDSRSVEDYGLQRQAGNYYPLMFSDILSATRLSNQNLHVVGGEIIHAFQIFLNSLRVFTGSGKAIRLT